MERVKGNHSKMELSILLNIFICSAIDSFFPFGCQEPFQIFPLFRNFLSHDSLNFHSPRQKTMAHFPCLPCSEGTNLWSSLFVTRHSNRSETSIQKPVTLEGRHHVKSMAEQHSLFRSTVGWNSSGNLLGGGGGCRVLSCDLGLVWAVELPCYIL